MSNNQHPFRSAPQREPSFRMSTAQLGMLFLFASLGMLFGGSVVAYLLTRSNNPEWDSVRFGLPWGLVAATGLLGGVSFALEKAVRSIQRNRQGQLLRWLYWGLGLVVGFLLLQTFNWAEIRSLNPSGKSHVLALFSFYMLTGLHAAHVLGGVVPLGLVIQRTTAREYSSSRYEGIKLLAQYWHFLGIVWLVVVSCLLAAR